MAHSVLIIGSSGSGKSASMMDLPAHETFIVNVASKTLPFRNNYVQVGSENPPGGGKIYNTDDPNKIIRSIQAAAKDPECKYAIIDDWQYASANEFMRRSEEKSYDKFTDIGKNIWKMARISASIPREDFIIYYLTHAEESYDSVGNKIMKAKTIGKLVDDKLTLEGMFTIVLFADIIVDNETKERRHVFKTKNSGNNTAKSPMGMFEEVIDNNLEVVSNEIFNFYE